MPSRGQKGAEEQRTSGNRRGRLSRGSKIAQKAWSPCPRRTARYYGNRVTNASCPIEMDGQAAPYDRLQMTRDAHQHICPERLSVSIGLHKFQKEDKISESNWLHKGQPVAGLRSPNHPAQIITSQGCQCSRLMAAPRREASKRQMET